MSGVEQLQIVGNKMLVRGLKLVVRIMPIRDPELLVGVDAVSRLAEFIAGRSVKKVLLVTGAGIVRRGQTDELVAALEKSGVETVIFTGVIPDPTFAVVNDGLDMLRQEGCDAVVAFGGGSAMDAAKVIAVA